MHDTKCGTTTPPKQAKSWGVSVNKVLAFIRSGELRAINMAASDKHRPRYVIKLEDVADFERRREVVPKPKAAARRRKPAHIKDYF